MTLRRSHTTCRLRGQGGFSLVEVALALLVVAIGLTAVFGLFPAGMQSSRAAVEETEMAEFADFVFEALEVLAARDWNDLTDAGLNGAALRPVVSTRIMGDTPTPDQKIRAASPNDPNLFVWQPANTELTTLLVSQVLTRFTYALQISDVPGFNGVVRSARLQIWPGPRQEAVKNGGGKDFPGSVLFYREFRKTS